MDTEETEEIGASASCRSTQARPSDREQDEELWFQDGTIILACRGTAFRVYRGPLIDQSPVFGDMLSLPQPSLDVRQGWNCPVVRLQDSPDDLRHLLRILMPSTQPQ